MKYTVRIEDQDYEVEIKDLRARPIVVSVDGVEITVEATPAGNGNGQLPRPAPAAPVVAATPAPTAIAPTSRPAPAAGGSVVRAPIPGVILTIMVKPGDTVTVGQELFIIEAMKMKNTIRANRSGAIAEVLVAPGTTVNHNAPIVAFVEG